MARGGRYWGSCQPNGLTERADSSKLQLFQKEVPEGVSGATAHFVGFIAPDSRPRARNTPVNYYKFIKFTQIAWKLLTFFGGGKMDIP